MPWLNLFFLVPVEDTSSDTSLTGLPQSLGRLAEIIIDQTATVQARTVNEGGSNKEAYKTVGTLIRTLSLVTGKLDCSQAEDPVVMKKVQRSIKSTTVGPN